MASARGLTMRRREFITLFGSAAAAWPLVARAQQFEHMRRIGVLSSLAETDVEAQAWDAAFRKRLAELGWVEGRNVRIDYRWGAGSVDRMRLFARELVQLNPDALVSISTPATAALQAESSFATLAAIRRASSRIGASRLPDKGESKNTRAAVSTRPKTLGRYHNHPSGQIAGK
jgi:ABC-type uncharacterized transport system substrate-binding protein